MMEIHLNQAKSLSSAIKDFNFEKLEVPITVCAKTQDLQLKSPFIEVQVNKMLMNSTVQLSFSYNHGET